MRRALSLTICASLLGSGCASTKPKKARTEVSELVAERAGIEDGISAEQDEESATQVRARIDELLAEPLDVDDALVVAILNNRGYQAALENLGIAQADLVQAGLLENPTVGGHLVNSTQGNGLGGGVSVSASLLSVLLIPAKRRVAKAKLQHAIVTAGDTTLHLVRDVRVAYATAQAAQADRDLHRRIVQAAEVSDELAERQLAAGNIGELQRAQIASQLDEARLALLDAEVAQVGAREDLTRLLGLWGEDIGYELTDAAPQLPEAEPELGQLEQRGVAERLDLSAARFQVESIEYALKLRRRGFVPSIDVGMEAYNEVGDHIGHEWVIGPSLSIELPIFDPGNADFARIRAMLRQSQHELQGASIDARSEIRVARAELTAARQRVDYYRDTVLPRHETITQESLEQYNGMLIGAYELFEIRAEQFHAQAEYAHALRDYWSARAELELAVGGRLE